MRRGEFDHEIHAYRVPSLLGSLEWMELSDRRVTLGFGPIAWIAGLDVKTYES
jgi:hypothetical protein